MFVSACVYAVLNRAWFVCHMRCRCAEITAFNQEVTVEKFMTTVGGAGSGRGGDSTSDTVKADAAYEVCLEWFLVHV